MTPWAIAHQTPLSTGLPRQEYWSWLPFPPPGDLPHPGIKPVSCVLHWQADSLLLCYLGSPCHLYKEKFMPCFRQIGGRQRAPPLLDIPQLPSIQNNSYSKVARSAAAAAKSLQSCPTRLPCPWDSPGMNTGVGRHFLLQCVKVKSESEVAQSCLTLSDPMDCSPPGSAVHRIFQARVLEWGAIAFSGKVWFPSNVTSMY